MLGEKCLDDIDIYESVGLRNYSVVLRHFRHIFLIVISQALLPSVDMFAYAKSVERSNSFHEGNTEKYKSKIDRVFSCPWASCPKHQSTMKPFLPSTISTARNSCFSLLSDLLCVRPQKVLFVLRNPSTDQHIGRILIKSILNLICVQGLN